MILWPRLKIDFFLQDTRVQLHPERVPAPHEVHRWSWRGRISWWCSGHVLLSVGHIHAPFPSWFLHLAIQGLGGHGGRSDQDLWNRWTGLHELLRGRSKFLRVERWPGGGQWGGGSGKRLTKDSKTPKRTSKALRRHQKMQVSHGLWASHPCGPHWTQSRQIIESRLLRLSAVWGCGMRFPWVVPTKIKCLQVSHSFEDSCC